jgi:hypothetical protein
VHKFVTGAANGSEFREGAGSSGQPEPSACEADELGDNVEFF